MHWIFESGFQAFGYIIIFHILCFIYIYTRSLSQKTKDPLWWQYGKVLFYAAVISIVMYALNDGTTEECLDSDPLYGGGDCYVTEEYEVDEDDRRKKAGTVFFVISFLSCMGIKHSKRSQDMFDAMASGMDKS